MGIALRVKLCVDGSCLLQRCAADLAGSVPPMAQGLNFFQENEIAVIDSTSQAGSYWVDAYQPDRVDAYEYSEEAAALPLADVAGGRFFADEPEAYATMSQGATEVVVLGQSLRRLATINGIALSAGDVDGDGLDEVVVLSTSGLISVCHADEGRCDEHDVEESGTAVDVAVGDIDGDGFDEPIVLFHTAGRARLRAIHPHPTEVDEVVGAYAADVGTDALIRITAGDLDGNVLDEVIGLRGSNELHLFDPVDSGTFTQRYASQTSGTVLDIEAGDVDLDDRAEVALLFDNRRVGLQVAGSAAFSSRATIDLVASVTPARLAMADHDGDAPRATLTSGPVPSTGALVPVMALLLPPYHQDYSDGVSSAAYGDQKSVGEGVSDTVSLGVSADVGVKASLFDVVGVKLSAKIDRKVSTTLSQRRTVTVGSRYSVRADPEQFGPRYGAVVVAWGCFDAYAYRFDDPAGHLSDQVDTDGETLVVTVPTGGGEALISTARYNSMADLLGLPRIDVPYQVGNPSSYPSGPQRLDGSPIPDDELLFPNPETYVASDVGQVSWRNSVGERASNSTNVSTSLGVSAGVEAFGVSVGAGASYGWGRSYSLDVGSSASFIGGMPPMPDNLSTPEDEYAVNRYSVQPWVYRETWSNPLGVEGAYWVMTYSVVE